MKKRIIQSLILLITLSGLGSYCYTESSIDKEMVIENPYGLSGTTVALSTLKADPTIEKIDVSISKATEEEIEEEDYQKILSQPVVFPDAYYNPETEEYREEEFWDDMELVALICVAEAEGETELGKRLVIDTIFNRVDSDYFPNTIREVVYAKNPVQYECVWNGRLERVEDGVEYDEYIASLVIEELNNRTNSEVVYFKTNGYFNFGTPIVSEGHHFFNGR